MTSEVIEVVSVDYNPAEFLVRAALYPRITDPRSGRASPMKMLAPTAIGGKNRARVWGWSVAYRAMLPTLDEVHDYGCRVADKSNQKKESDYAERGKPFERPLHTIHYVGSYDLSLQRLTEVTSPYYDVSVEPWETDGLPEHSRIRIDVRDETSQSEDDLAGDRTEIIWQLFDLLENFSPYICQRDRDDNFTGILEAMQRKLLNGEFESKDGPP